MFQVYSDINKTKSQKKKLFFISTITSNKVEQISFEKTNPKYSCSFPISTESNFEKKVNLERMENQFKNLGNIETPFKKIFFKLYHTSKKNNEKEKKKQNPKKICISAKKKLNFNYKQKRGFNKSLPNKDFSAGRWKEDEHQRFIDGVIKYGNNWRLVQKYVGTRTGTQTRSHAQKFFEKLKRSKIFRKEKYDFSKNSLKLLHDIMANLSDDEYDKTLKKLHSLSYFKTNKNDFHIKGNEQKKENENTLNDIIIENENKENEDIQEEKLEKIKFNNKGYYYIETNNNKIYNNNDYFIHNNSNFYFNYDYTNFGIRSRKGSDIYNNQRKNSLYELIEAKDQNDNKEEYNNNNSYINDNISEYNSLNRQNDNIDYSFSQQSSRKLSLEEGIIESVF